MNLLIHAVGDSDLGLDIVGIKDEPRDQLREQRTEALRESLHRIGSDDIAADLLVRALLHLSYNDAYVNERFNSTPLSRIFEALKGNGTKEVGDDTSAPPRRSIHIVLLASMTGYRQTKPLADVLNDILNNSDVSDVIGSLYEVDVTAEVVDGSLSERETLDAFTNILAEKKKHIDDVTINAMSGSTAVMIAALGAADKTGLRWRLMLAPEHDRTAAKRVEQHQIPDEAEFRWLCSLGLLHDAIRWAQEQECSDLITKQIRAYADVADHLDTPSAAIDETVLGRLACLWLMRADNGAGLAVRAWVQAHYEALLERENKERAEPWTSVFAPNSNGRTPMLGAAIGRLDKQIDDGLPTSSAGSWLVARAALGAVGNSAVHDAAVPTLAALEEARSTPELAAGAPSWMSWPADRPVLYLYACGLDMGSRRQPIAKRVLTQPPQPSLLQAVPAGMLADEPPLPVVLRMLHSGHPNSRNKARREMAVVIDAEHDTRWRLGASDNPAVQTVEYRPDGAEGAGEAEVLEAVRVETALILAQVQPVAVVIVGSGSKGAVLGALQEAQEWCAYHAAPLFLQTFVDRDGGVENPAPQFHRIAMHTGVEKALRKAASASLRSLNLLSAVRVLSAGDQEMAALAQECEQLRQEYTDAMTAEDLDQHAGVVLDVLATIIRLWEGAQDDWETQVRLIVAAAEITKCKRIRPKGTISLLRNPAKALQSQQIDERLAAGSQCAVENLTRGDMQCLLYNIRNNLVITHGKGTIDQAMDGAFADAQVAREGMSYPDLLRTTVERLRSDIQQDRKIENRTIIQECINSSDWGRRLIDLIDNVEPKVVTDGDASQ